MKITIKTKEQLEKEGWRVGLHDAVLSSRWNDKNAPRIGHRVLSNLGETLEVTSVCDVYEEPDFSCICKNGYYLRVPYYAIDGQIPDKYKVKDKRIKKTIKGEVGVYYKTFDKFKFPCAWSELTTKEAIQVANWVLKVAGK